MDFELDLVTMRKWYGVILIVVTLSAVILVMLDLVNVVDLMTQPLQAVNDMMIAFFTFDYFWRLFHSKDKWRFIKANIFDLIAIIPFYTIFNLFGFDKMMSVGKFMRFALLSRLVGVAGKLNHSTNRFLKTNGFYHLIYVAFIMIMVASYTYSTAEKVSFGESLWWAISTTTTVGYGDIAPHTVLGKVAASILMLLGIGIIGLLTSTITNYFTEEKNERIESKESEQSHEMAEMNKKIDVLLQKIEQLENNQKTKE